jgi:hypothetical protein
VNETYPVKPSYLPFRALTNHQVDNLLVAGLTMAQSFMANSALRMHPIEWISGQAAGVAAALMVQKKLATTAELYQSCLPELQVGHTHKKKMNKLKNELSGHRRQFLLFSVIFCMLVYTQARILQYQPLEWTSE